jgi:hypothetical protein
MPQLRGNEPILGLNNLMATLVLCAMPFLPYDLELCLAAKPQKVLWASGFWHFPQQPTPTFPNSESMNSNGARINGPRSSFRLTNVIYSDSDLWDSLACPPVVSSRALPLRNVWISSMCPFPLQHPRFIPLFVTSQRFILALGNSSRALNPGSPNLSPQVSSQ